jgi:5'-methylthioinosine phosphorylase
LAGVAVIGGTGLSALAGLEITGREVVNTPWGEPSGPLTKGTLAAKTVAFLPRHGYGHTIPPHRVNYRANIAALQLAGFDQVIAVAAVGGIRADLASPSLVVPDQLLDYTWGRAHTFYEEQLTSVVHVDFSFPYCPKLRTALIEGAGSAGVRASDGGVYGVTQGPRLETSAEIDRLERDGCDVVGMTGMPEAGLAREAGLRYAHLCLVVNPAAGRGIGEISMNQIEANVRAGAEQVHRVLEQVVAMT